MGDPLLDLVGVQTAPAQQPAAQQDPLLSLVGVSAQAAAQPAAQRPAAPQPTSLIGGAGNFLYGLTKGAADMVQGGAQNVLHGADALYGALASGPDDKRGPSGNLLHSLTQRFDQHLAGQESEYQRATDGSIAAGVGRVGANVAPAIAGGMVATGAPLAASLVGRMGVGAAAGGAQGLMAPVLSGNYGDEKPRQILTGAAVGGALPGIADVAGRVLRPVVGAARNALRSAPAPAVIDSTINDALQQSGMDLAQLPAQVAQGIRDDVTQAMKTGGDISPDALRRLADYRLTGATPTAATVTLDPAMVSQQKNLAKLGINSKDVAAQQLGQVENANNRQLITGLNTLGANTPDDAIAGAGRIMGALDQRNGRAKDVIDTLYQQARDTSGRSAALDPHAFTQRASDMLDEALLGGKLPGDVRDLLNKAATGNMPLTVDVAEQLKTRIGDLQRASADASERKALGMVRSALDDTPLLPGQQIGQQSIDAFNKARGMNRAWMGIVDKTPALQAVRDGIEPDKFVQQYIVGTGPTANAMDVAMLKNSIKSSPDAMAAVRGQITAFLKQRALNGAADEVGNFSQSAYNKALTSIGDRKLNLFFSPDDIGQMKAIGRVASYDQFQPKGSAVNNSNTAAAGISAILDRIGASSLLSKVPVLGKALQEPVQNIAVGMRAQRALNVPGALSSGPLPFQPLPGAFLASPVGAIVTQQQKDDELRRRGLLQ